MNKIVCKDECVFALADALRCDLYDMQGVIRGSTSMKMPLPGGMALPCTMTVCSDETSASVLSAFVHLRADFWMYVMFSDEKTGVAFVFDGKPHDLRPGGEHRVGRGLAKDTLKTIRDTIRSALMYNPDNKTWVREEATELLEGV